MDPKCNCSYDKDALEQRLQRWFATVALAATGSISAHGGHMVLTGVMDVCACIILCISGPSTHE